MAKTGGDPGRAPGGRRAEPGIQAAAAGLGDSGESAAGPPDQAGGAAAGPGGPGTGAAAARAGRGARLRPAGGGRPTMKDVAAYAGVGLKTVSRVVNGEPGVRPATAIRVRAAIEQLGFRRNDSARLLRTGQTASIGLILEDIGDPFYSALARAVEDVARSRGSLLFIGSSDEDPVRERELALAFCARRVDGLVIVPAADDHTYLVPEMAAGVAMVFADRPAGLVQADAVLSDNAGGAREGTSHLIRAGHRRIGFIGDSPRIYTAMQRLRGYRDAMAQAGLKVADPWVEMSQPTAASVERSLRAMLAGASPVSAVFCANNRVSIHALRALDALGRRLALVGFDDFELAGLLRPAVTVVAQDVAELGRVAAETLLDRIAGQDGPPVRIEVPTRLIPRGSGELSPA